MYTRTQPIMSFNKQADKAADLRYSDNIVGF